MGQVLTFTILGVMAAVLGEVFGFSSQNHWVQIGVGLFLALFGLASLFNIMPAFLQKINNIQLNRFSGTFLFPIILGASSALLASPCTTPVLGAVLVTISASSQILTGTFYMFFYALGATSLFLVFGLGIVSAKKIPQSGNWMKHVHTLSALLVLLASVFFLYQGISYFFEV